MRLLLTFILLTALPAFADVAVIVNLENANSLSEKQVRSIYLAKAKYYPNDEEVSVYSLKDSTKTTDLFNTKVLKKSQSSLNSYWARMLFSSKGFPPYEVNGNETMRQQVASNKAAIGYIDSGFIDSSVRVLFIIKSE